MPSVALALLPKCTMLTITLQALHHAHAILALRAAGLRQNEDEEKRRAEEGETRESR
jgi:hypothetical protein